MKKTHTHILLIVTGAKVFAEKFISKRLYKVSD